MNHAARVGCALVTLLAVAREVNAQSCVFAPTQEVKPSTGSAAAGFGDSVAVDQDRLVIGAAADGVGGAVYVFERVGDYWFESATLVAPDASFGDGFGALVDVKGDRIAVVAPGADVAGASDRGAVYVFQLQGAAWSFDGKVWPSIAASLAGPLAHDIAIDGDLLLASAPHYAFVFERVSSIWSESQVLSYPGNGWTNFDIEFPMFAVMNNGGSAKGFKKQGVAWTPFVNYPSVNGGAGIYWIDLDAGRAAMCGAKLVVADALTGAVLNTQPGPCEQVSLSGDRVVIRAGAKTRVLKLLPSSQGVEFVVDLEATPGVAPINPRASADRVVGVATASVGGMNSVYAFKNHTFETFGLGCPGAAGFTPTLTLGTCSAPGSPISVAVQGALGGATGLMFLGTGVTTIPIGANCSFFVNHVFPSPLSIPFSGGGPGAGSLQINSALPVSMPTVSIALQAFVLDSASPIGASSTNAVIMSIP